MKPTAAMMAGSRRGGKPASPSVASQENTNRGHAQISIRNSEPPAQGWRVARWRMFEVRSKSSAPARAARSAGRV